MHVSIRQGVVGVVVVVVGYSRCRPYCLRCCKAFAMLHFVAFVAIQSSSLTVANHGRSCGRDIIISRHVVAFASSSALASSCRPRVCHPSRQDFEVATAKTLSTPSACDLESTKAASLFSVFLGLKSFQELPCFLFQLSLPPLCFIVKIRLHDRHVLFDFQILAATLLLTGGMFQGLSVA